MWVTIRECSFFRKDGSIFKIPKGTELKEVSRLEKPRLAIWKDIKSMNRNSKNRGKRFIVLWCKGMARIFTINDSVIRCSQGVGNIWRP